MKRQFKIVEVKVGSWSTNFSIKDIDHKNPNNRMGEAAFFHHLGHLAGVELEDIEGLEFSVELSGGKLGKIDPLDLCGTTIGGKTNQAGENMTKDKQIKHLVEALESIRDDHAPWHGENAVDMMNNAHNALIEMENAVEFKNKLFMAQNAHTRDLNKDPIETYAETLSRLYFVLKDTVEKMDTALEGAIDYPSELSTSDEVDVRMFLKEADILLKSYFELFIKFSDR